MPEITKIQLPSGNTYELRDSDAQGKLENVYTKSETYTRAEVQAVIADAMKGGYVAVTTLPTASDSTMGHIYLIPGTTVSGDNTRIEYVTIRSGSEGAYTYTWEELGTTELNLDNLELEKGSGDMVLGEDTTFTVSKPNINITGGSSDTFVKSYPGTTSKLATTTVPNVTGNTDVTIPNVTGNTDVSIPNVTGNDSKTLTFEMGTGNDATTLIIGGSGFASGSNTYTASAVTLGTALSASKVTLGTALSASKVTLGTAKTVATGSLTSSGSGAEVMTGLGTAVTASAVTGVGTAALASNPTVTVGTNDKVKVAKYDDLELQKP